MVGSNWVKLGQTGSRCRFRPSVIYDAFPSPPPPHTHAYIYREPLLEPWNFHVKFNLKSEFADTLYVAFSSGDPLRLNVAPHFVRTANAVVDIAKKQYKVPPSPNFL